MMELFTNAAAVRLRSRHGKYLTAGEDGVSVCQDRDGSSRLARWAVEFAEGGHAAVRLRSCCGRYLAASGEPFPLGVTSRKVLQALPSRGLGPPVEWEPVRDGFQVRLRSHRGNFLRANGGLPPWRNSVIHDVPHRTALWDVEVVEVLQRSAPCPALSAGPGAQPSSPPRPSAAPPASESSSPCSARSFDTSPRMSSLEPIGAFPKYDGRTISYIVVDEDSNVEEGLRGAPIQFEGRSVQELAARLKQQAGLSDVIVCSKNPLNGKLCPLRLPLPPSHSAMEVVLVGASSRVAKSLTKSEFPS